MAAEPTPVPMSAEWFRDKLYKRLTEVQQPEVEFFSAYYCGEHPLP